jgi:DNA-binding response OmpR family regulator
MPRNKKRVLVVDNDDDVLHMLCVYVRSWALQADCADSAMKALALHQEKPYDLIITDAAMPEMSGLELAEKIRAAKDETPILLLTAYQESMMTAKARDAGIDQVSFKPVEPADLRRVVLGMLAPPESE